MESWRRHPCCAIETRAPDRVITCTNPRAGYAKARILESQLRELWPSKISIALARDRTEHYNCYTTHRTIAKHAPDIRSVPNYLHAPALEISHNAARHIHIFTRFAAIRRPPMERTPHHKRADQHASRRRWLFLHGNGQHKSALHCHRTSGGKPVRATRRERQRGQGRG